jgi:hypothetical protein
MTQPFYQPNTNIIQNNVNSGWVEMNSFSSAKNDSMSIDMESVVDSKKQY